MKVCCRLATALLSGLVVAAACDSPSVPDVALEGRVLLLDEGARRLSSTGPATVTILGPGESTIAETTTEDDGSFVVQVASEGPFSLTARRDGFGATRLFDVVPGRGRVDVELVARSSAAVSSVEADARPCGGAPCLRLAAEVDNFLGDETTRRVFRIFMSRDAAVSPENYEATETLFVPNDQPGLQVIGGGRVRFELDGSFSPLSTFPSGSTVHVRLHGATENLSSSYWDPIRGLSVFPDLSEGWAGTSVVIP